MGGARNIYPNLQKCVIDRKSSTVSFDGLRQRFYQVKDTPTLNVSMRVVQASLKELEGYFFIPVRCDSYELIKVKKAVHGLQLKYDLMIVRFIRENGGPLQVTTTKYYVK